MCKHVTSHSQGDIVAPIKRMWAQTGGQNVFTHKKEACVSLYVCIYKCVWRGCWFAVPAGLGAGFTTRTGRIQGTIGGKRMYILNISYTALCRERYIHSPVRCWLGMICYTWFVCFALLSPTISFFLSSFCVFFRSNSLWFTSLLYVFSSLFRNIFFCAFWCNELFCCFVLFICCVFLCVLFCLFA